MKNIKYKIKGVAGHSHFGQGVCLSHPQGRFGGIQTTPMALGGGSVEPPPRSKMGLLKLPPRGMGLARLPPFGLGVGSATPDPDSNLFFFFLILAFGGPCGWFGHPQAKWGWPRLLGVVSTTPIFLLGGDSATALAKPPPYFFFPLIFKFF
jgi:hypothetical protein